MAGNTVHVQGSYVDVHDNEVVNLSIDKAGTVNVGEAQNVSNKEEEETEAEKEDRLIKELRSIFYGDLDAVKRFLLCIKDAKPKQITELVKQWVKENKISEISCHRDLWKVLNEAGLYTLTESNWNQNLKEK